LLTYLPFNPRDDVAVAIRIALMKTTVEINDPLLREARKLAARENTTLRALIEEGLHLVLAEKKQKPFRLRRASFRGRGLRPELKNASWSEIRAMSYQPDED
jgi:hypothetical protein